MKTEDAQGSELVQDAEKNDVTPLKRVGRAGLSILNPFSDLMVIYRKGLRPTLGHVREAWAQINRRSSPSQSLSWAQAVSASGKTVEQLRTTFTRIRMIWWCLMMVSGGLAMLLLIMLLLAQNLPTGTLLRAVITLLLLVGACGLGFVRNLITTYRLWQLQQRRVSASEGGTFQDFISENQWWRQVLTLVV